MALAGTAADIPIAIKMLQQMGPDQGYFPEPEKRLLFCNSTSVNAVKETLQEFTFQNKLGNRYLGGFIGNDLKFIEWIEQKIGNWVKAIQALAKVAINYPQTVYAGLCKSLQMEWQYLQQILPNSAKFFDPIKEVIKNEFIPALLGDIGKIPEEL